MSGRIHFLFRSDEQRQRLTEIAPSPKHLNQQINNLHCQVEGDCCSLFNRYENHSTSFNRQEEERTLPSLNKTFS